MDFRNDNTTQKQNNISILLGEILSAPKGNQYALGNMGTPKQYTCPEDMQVVIDEYFEKCKTSKIPLTVEGLGIALELDRAGIINYQKTKGYEDYFNTIKKAKAKILQNKIENGLNSTNNTAFAIFDLKNNFGFKDKQETEVSGKFETVQIYLPDNGRSKKTD